MNEETDGSDKIPEFFLEKDKKSEPNEKLVRTNNNPEKKKPHKKTLSLIHISEPTRPY